MSTYTAVAPPLGLFTGPAPRPPLYGLLAQLERLGGLTVGESHFEAGANMWMYPCGLALPDDPCAVDDGTFNTKDDGDDSAGDVFQFLAFTAYLPVTCSSFSVGANDRFGSFFDRVSAAFRSVESAAVEKELSQGTALGPSGNQNPYFSDANMTLPGGAGALTPEVGLRWLEYAIGLSGRQGVIHAPPQVVAAWRYDELDVDDQGVLRTLANGTPVIAGPGYIGSGAPSSGTAWAFATGPLQVRQGEEVRLADYRESVDRSDNTVTVRAERDYVAAFDPCVQAGTLIDWTP